MFRNESSNVSQEIFFLGLAIISNHMFKALYGFFNLIFMLILFKMFTPGLFDLAVTLLTTMLTFMNEAANQLSSTGVPDTFPNGL
jgi:hypothetical protein